MLEVKKCPILLKCQAQVNIPNYVHRINLMINKLEEEYDFNELYAFLVLKDILYNVWKSRKDKSNQ